MKKIAIVTLFYKNYNYGGILQAYALCRICSELGYDVEVLKLDRFCVNRFKDLLRKFFKRSNNASLCEIEQKRIKFEKFISNYIKTNGKVLNKNNIASVVNKYDIFICGSDQVWSPVSGTPETFLTFVPETKKKIAYAASIGANSISDEYGMLIKPFINRIGYCSVREEGAQSIVHNLLPAKNCRVVLDPTLLLDYKKWREISQQVSGLNGTSFVLMYFLGEDDEAWNEAYQVAKDMNKRIVNIPFNKMKPYNRDINHPDLCVSGVGPAEFIWLIDNADCVLTDSFHGIVFSVIFEKKYKIFERAEENMNGSMSGRLESLMSILSLDKDNLDGHLDFDEINKNIVSNRNESMEFLCNALEN